MILNFFFKLITNIKNKKQKTAQRIPDELEITIVKLHAMKQVKPINNTFFIQEKNHQFFDGNIDV